MIKRGMVAAGLLGGLLQFALLHAATSPDAIPSPSPARLPEAVTSFGAVVNDGYLYVFGGHKGERHDYSVDQVSGSFHRLRLKEGATWEQLPASQPGQGLPLVAEGRTVYRIGGMAAQNPADQKQDLISTTLVQRYHPSRKRWDNLAPLPAPRSSHDAVVIGRKLYVAGGWQMTGGTNKSIWPANALVLDLARPGKGWKEFPQPFQRRALALAALGDKIFCIGGMNSDNKPTLAVDVYDTKTGQWSKGPDLPEGKFKGFSCSAIAQDGRIYASAFQGDLLRLSLDQNSWEVVGRLQHPRMAHRLVAAGNRNLVALGGEDGESKRPDLEWLIPSPKPIPSKPSATAQNQTASPHAN